MTRGTANPELTAKVGKKASQPVHMKHYQNEQHAITRMSALKAAVAFVEPFAGKVTIPTVGADGEETKVAANLQYYQKLTLETAELFEAWLTRDETTAPQD